MQKLNFKDLIIYENDDYIVINKPAGVSTLEDRDLSVCIKEMAKEYWPDAQVCHRLDKETTGALAIAKNPDAYRSLSMQFESRQVTKIYHAVVEGIVEFDNEVVEKPIRALKKGIVVIDFQKGKQAKTILNTVRAYKRHSLIECKPITGRMHQIRIHLSSKHAPIAGDEQYGGKNIYLSELKKRFNLKKGTEEQPLMQRVALHARELTFNLLNGENITITADYPKDYAVMIKQLEKNS
jgi:23S rRNA pseudouridine955/2504/2580 synthase